MDTSDWYFFEKNIPLKHHALQENFWSLGITLRKTWYYEKLRDVGKMFRKMCVPAMRSRITCEISPMGVSICSSWKGKKGHMPDNNLKNSINTKVKRTRRRSRKSPTWEKLVSLACMYDIRHSGTRSACRRVYVSGR